MYVCVCIHIYRTITDIGDLPPSFSTLLFELGSLTEPCAHCLSWLAVSPRDPPISVSRARVTGAGCCTWLSYGFGDPNSGSRDCAKYHLPTPRLHSSPMFRTLRGALMHHLWANCSGLARQLRGQTVTHKRHKRNSGWAVSRGQGKKPRRKQESTMG